MMLQITREHDFSTVEIEFPDFMVDLSKSIAKQFSNFEILPVESGDIKILIEDHSVDRVDREITGNGKYFVTISKY